MVDTTSENWWHRKRSLTPRVVSLLNRAYKKRGLLVGNPINTVNVHRAFKALDQGRLEVAEARFRSALKCYRKDYRAHIGLAKIATKRGNLDQGLRYWDDSILALPGYLKLNMGNLDPELGKIESLLDMYRFSECRLLSRKVIQERPANPEAYFLLARSYMREGNFIQALELWRDIENRFPNNPKPVIGRVNCLLETGDYADAEKLLTSAGLRWPDHTEFTLIRARLALRMGNYSLAKNILQKTIEQHPGRVTAYKLLGQSFQGLGDIEALQPFISKVPAQTGFSEEFIVEVLLPYYIDTHNWESYLRCISEFADKGMSPRAANVMARYHLLNFEFDKLVDLVELTVDKYPYYLPSYRFLLRGYQRKNLPGKMLILKEMMVVRFGQSVVYPILIDMGSSFIDTDFPAISQWLIENPSFRKRYMSRLLDCLLLSGDEKEMAAIALGLKGQLTPAENIRILGIDCQIKDMSLLRSSRTCKLDWAELEINKKDLYSGVETTVNSLTSENNRHADMQKFYERYLATLIQYDAAHLYSRESYHDAVTLLVSLLNRVEERIPTSLVRLGDGEGNYLPYRLEAQQCIQLDQRAIQNLWWGQDLIGVENSTKMGLRLMDTINNADFMGVPPLWRIIGEFFKNGEIDLTERYNRGSVAIIDLLSSDRLDRNKTLMSSAVHNDFSRWDLYSQLFAPVDSVSYISCHNLEPFLAQQYGLESRQKFLIPGEYAYREMFEERDSEVSHTKIDETEVQKIYPHVFEAISREIQPRPGEIYLVAAGFLGKFFCDLVKRRGGIGIDIGSTADYWMGYETRRYKNNQFVFDPTSSGLINMPLKSVVHSAGVL